MLKLCRFTKVKVSLLVLVDDFNFGLFEFSAPILEKGLFKFVQEYTYLGTRLNPTGNFTLAQEH